MLGEIINIIYNLMDKTYNKKNEDKEIMIKIAQLVDKQMTNYCKEMRDFEKVNNPPLLIEENIGILIDGLEKMLTTLNNIKSSEYFSSLNASFRQEFPKLIEYIVDKMSLIDEEEYFDEVYEVRKEINEIIEFYDSWMKILYSK